MESRRFDIRLTRGDYLRYFVRHYFFDLWLPWIVSAGVAVVFTFLGRDTFTSWWAAGITFVLLFLGTLLCMFALSTLIFTLKLRQMKEGGIVLETKHVTVGDEGIQVEGSASRGEYGWSQVEWVRARGRFVFVKLTGAELLLLWPQRSVPDGLVESMQTQLQAAPAEAAA